MAKQRLSRSKDKTLSKHTDQDGLKSEEDDDSANFSCSSIEYQDDKPSILLPNESFVRTDITREEEK